MGTSATAAKSRYNRKNYDHITIRTRKGGNDAINELASIRKRSKSDYIRELIRADARRMNRYDLAQAVGSGNPDNIAPHPPLVPYGTSGALTAREKFDCWLGKHGAGETEHPKSLQDAFNSTFNESAP